MAIYSNPPLVHNKPLGAPVFVRLTYYIVGGRPTLRVIAMQSRGRRSTASTTPAFY